MDKRKINQIPLDIKKPSFIEDNSNIFKRNIEKLSLISFWRSLYNWVFIIINTFLIIFSIFIITYNLTRISSKILLISQNNNAIFYSKYLLLLFPMIIIFITINTLYISYKMYYKTRGLCFLANTLGLSVNFLIFLDIYKLIQISL
jgi:hypothetical protein